MIYDLFASKNRPKLAVLVDPDKYNNEALIQLIARAENCKVDFIFIGGSLLLHNTFETAVTTLKNNTKIPVVIFPGSNYQISKNADAILLLSLVSGRNAEYLIGQHVTAAPIIKEAGIEVLSTAYLLIDGGRISTTAYITQTLPIPADKIDVAVATAIAAEMQGTKLVYLEAGSGAPNTVSADMIKAVKQNVALPVIVGGGIRTAEQAEEICKAGADVIVVGNALEKEPELLLEISLAVHGTHKVQ